jgi:hypothetical protein
MKTVPVEVDRVLQLHGVHVPLPCRLLNKRHALLHPGLATANIHSVSMVAGPWVLRSQSTMSDARTCLASTVEEVAEELRTSFPMFPIFVRGRKVVHLAGGG